MGKQRFYFYCECMSIERHLVRAETLEEAKKIFDDGGGDLRDEEVQYSTLTEIENEDGDVIEKVEEPQAANEAFDAMLSACQRVLRAINWDTTEDRMSQEEMTAVLEDAIEKAGGAT